MDAKEKKKKYDKEYQKKQVSLKTIKLFKNTDKDILDYINGINKPFATYVKELIRKDIKESKK